MKTFDQHGSRRHFFKICGLSTLPLFVPVVGRTHSIRLEKPNNDNQNLVNFVSDGLFFSPAAYLEKLLEINQSHPINQDFYGSGGATKKLEELFAELTGKEKAIFMPSGTMANQLAIKVLNDDNTKVVVPENSHVFRDEADAAQAVHHQRLIPVGKDKAFFDQQDLEKAINYLDQGEVFKSGLGTVVLEHPIRRADGVAIPIETIKNISAYCKKKGYKLHLDGARLHLASAFTGISIAEYASYFDTVYISLYKYLNTTGGAVLCGDAEVIDKMAHQIKIYGGTTFQTWGASAMALHFLEDIDLRWKKVIARIHPFATELNKIEEVDISKIENGTNIYTLKLAKSIDVKSLAIALYDENIWLGRANEDGLIKLQFNESLLRRELNDLIDVWKRGIYAARK